MSKFSKKCLIGSAVVLLAAWSQQQANALNVAETGQPLGVAFVYLGNPGDAGWTYAHDQGAKQLERDLGSKVKVTRVENVPEGSDSERVIRDLANQGDKVVIATSFGYMDSVAKVARDFPDVTFLHATGYRNGPNYTNYNARTYETAYLAGVLAGLTTKTHQLGYVASVPIPEVVRNIDAFEIGARSVDPKAQTRVVWINAWFDPGKEREAAESLISLGADVLMQNTDSPAVLQTAEEKHIHAFGWDSDMSRFGPHAHLASSVIHWGVYYDQAVTAILKGTWKNTSVWWGLKEGMIDLEDVNRSAVPPAAFSVFTERRQAMIDGTTRPFTGPLKDQAGQLRVPAGKPLSDADLLSINWLVDGVQGAVPK